MKLIICRILAFAVILAACVVTAQVYRNMDRCYNKGGKLLSDRIGNWQCYKTNTLKPLPVQKAASK